MHKKEKVVNEINLYLLNALKWLKYLEPVAPKFSVKKMPLQISQNLQENNCTRASFLTKLQAEFFHFIKQETLVQVFFCEFCETFMTTYFIEHFRTTASEYQNQVAIIQRI